MAPAASAEAPPAPAGSRLLVERTLPHVPPDAKVTVLLDGREAAAFAASDAKAATAIGNVAPGEHSVSLRVVDPEFRSRVLYQRSVIVRVPNAAPKQGAAPSPGGEAKTPTPLPAPDVRLRFGLDGTAWQVERSGAPPAALVWDAAGTAEHLLKRRWPAGEMDAEARVGTPAPGAVAPGCKGVRITVRCANRSGAPLRVLAAGVRVQSGKTDVSPRFLILPAAPLPAVLPPGGSAEAAFRLDTFDDTPAGRYQVEPVVVWVPAAADLLADGGGERAGALARRGANEAEKAGWFLPADAPDTLSAAAVAAGAPYAEIADRVADWREFARLSLTNAGRTATQGAGLLEAAFAPAPAQARAVAEQGAAGIRAGERYVAGVDSWAGTSFRVEMLDAGGAPAAVQEREMSGSWWTCFWSQGVTHWFRRTLTIRAPEGTASARLSLLAGRAQSPRSWWDNAFLVPERALRSGVGKSAVLEVAPAAPARRPVVYLGEDRANGGNWIGKYGSHAWILCAMSAPRDMVGGVARPLKCRHDDMSRTYANEEIGTPGKEEVRYASWTGDARDVLTRHWIGAKRTEERRALENPQWGCRTYASWDEHGEMHPSDGWGPDLYVRLRVPAGLWQLGLYFMDWDWFAAPYPRAHRLAFLDEKGAEICTARVAGFGQGVTKLFGVQGGRDVLLRIRKDFSPTVVLSGIFLDALRPAALSPADARLLQGPLPQVVRGVGELARLAAVDPPAYLRRAGSYAAFAEALARSEPRGPSEAAAWRRVRAQLLGHAPGCLDAEAEAYRAYAEMLPRAVGGEQTAGRILVEAGDAAFRQGDPGAAERAYDAALALQARTEKGAVLAGRHRVRALQFRRVHPAYALAQCRALLAAAAGIPPDAQVKLLRAVAREFLAAAERDWKESRGRERVPYRLPTEVLRRLREVRGTAGLEAKEREDLVLCLERQTWYDLGWRELAAEQERLLASLRPEQGTGALLERLLRTYAVLAAQDAGYLKSAEETAQRLRGTLPDGEHALAVDYALWRIYVQTGRPDAARKVGEQILARWPQRPEAAAVREFGRK